MAIVPSPGMMIITMIIMGLVAARQSEAHDEEKEPDANQILYSVFHVRWFLLTISSKILPIAKHCYKATLTHLYIKYCRYFSTETLKNATKVV